MRLPAFLRPASVAACLFAGCAGNVVAPEQYLDPQTAVTVTSMRQPWVYAHEDLAIAKHARDYLNVGLLEVNRTGTRRYWLVVVAWTTIDRSALNLPPPAPIDALQLERFDDAAIRLAAERGGRRIAGTSRAYFDPPGAARTRESWFELSTAQFTGLAAQPPTSISIAARGDREVTFAPWRVDSEYADALKASVAPPGGADAK